MALLMASSASTEQWIFTGGRFSSSTICEFLMASASSTVLPLIHSVASDDEAMAEPHPKVLNLASSMTPSSETRICRRITSPHAGAPTRPVPTFGSSLSSVPTFRGFSAWSITFSLYAMTLSSFGGSSVSRPVDGLQIDSFFVHLVERRHVAQVLHLRDHELRHVVDLFLRVESTDAERAEHVARLEARRRAGRAAGDGDVLDRHHHRFALDEVERDVEVPRQAVLVRAVQVHLVERALQLAEESLAKRGETRVLRRPLLHHDLAGDAEADDARDVERAA